MSSALIEFGAGHMRPKILIGLLAIGFLSACATPADIQLMPSPTPRVVAAGTSAKPVQLRRVVIRMERGTTMGAGLGGYLCVPRTTLVYNGSGTNEINDNRFNETFREELQKANYVVAGNPTDLFDEPSDSGAELAIAGIITGIKLNACVHPNGETKGEAAIVVEWQVFNRMERRVVHQVTTRGTGRTDTTSAGGAGVAMQAAFAQAIRGLLADEAFHRLATGQSVAAVATDTAPSFQLQAREPVTDSIASRIVEVQNGVVTIRTPRGHGSGFIISADGYVLTNRHVVGDNRSVQVKLASGREFSGDVVAANAQHDVALIRVSDISFTALPIARTELPVGSEVYALGSPLSERLSATVTRGIISGYRSIGSVRYIQSDVNVQRGNSGGPLTDASGNVVGIAVFGVAQRGASIGLNFFLPIGEALKNVGIERLDAQSSARATDTRMVQLTPTRPAPQPASATVPAQNVDAPPPLASAALPGRGDAPSFDGDYQTVIPANVFPDLARFPITILVRGNAVTGWAEARSIGKSDHVCRVNGTIGADGNMMLELFCSAMSVDTVKIAYLTGKFTIDTAQPNVKVAHTNYRTNEGKTGLLTWSPVVLK